MSNVRDIGSAKKPQEPCQFCNGDHAPMTCPRVEYIAFEDGAVSEVQFFPPSVWKPE